MRNKNRDPNLPKTEILSACGESTFTLAFHHVTSSNSDAVTQVTPSNTVTFTDAARSRIDPRCEPIPMISSLTPD